MEHERKTTEHPSQGSITFSRIQGNPGQLYGSSLRLNHYIKMELHYSAHTRDLNTDWYYPRELIASIAMSPTQFAELITSLNYGSGIPCTIEWANGKDIERGDFVNKIVEFEDEFAGRMDQLADKAEGLADKVVDALAKGRVSKKATETILGTIRILVQEIRSNIPYTYKCFNEQMDKSVQEAKLEVESYVAHKVNTLGLKALQDKSNDFEVKLLGGGE